MIEYRVQVYEDRTEWLNQDGLLHRLDGPAIEYVNGSKSWYIDGQRHRLDGPAIEYFCGSKSWYIDGNYYSEEDFKEKVKETKSPCEGKIVEVDGKKYQLKKI